MKKKVIISVLVILVVALAGTGGLMWHYVSKETGKNPSEILDNISVGPISVGGMTKDQAAEAVEQYIETTTNNKLVLVAGKKNVSIPFAKMEIAFKVDDSVKEAYDVGRTGNIISRFFAVRKLKKEKKVLPLKKSIDKERITKLLKAREKHLVARAENAYIIQEKGKPVIKKEEKGHRLEFDKSIDTIKTAVEGKWNGKNQKVKLAVKTESPKYTAKDLEGKTDILGTYETSYRESPLGRCRNIENGTKLINGTFVEPGKSFSVYKHVAPFTPENGYFPAPTIQGEKHIDDYGGGICQVSTTLYNAVIRSELKVKERHHHSQAIYYVPLSADAAISGNELDFKFINNSKELIYISGQAGVKGRTLRFTIYGHDSRPKNRTIAFETRNVATYVPGQKIVGKDPNLPVGRTRIKEYGVTGYHAELWKIIKMDGKIKKQYRFNSSSYQAVAAKVVKGTKKKEKKDKKDKGKKNNRKKP